MPDISIKEEWNDTAEEYFKSIVETIREPLLVLNEQLLVISANRAFYDLFRVSPEQTLHKHIFEMGSGEWNENGLRRLLLDVVPYNKQFHDYLVDYDFPAIGHRIMRINGRKIVQQEGISPLILFAIEDVTERVKMEKAVNEYTLLINYSPDNMARYTLDGRYISNNRAFERLIGMPRSKIIGKRLGELVAPPEMTRLIKAGFDQAIRTRIEAALQVKLKDKYLHIFVVPEIDKEGNVVSLMTFTRDITSLKKTEQELRENEEKYRTLVENANDGIIIVQDGIVKYANMCMAVLDESTPESIVGTPFVDHIYPSEIPKLLENYRRRMAGEYVPTPYETVLRRRNGEPAPAEINAAAINYHGKPADLVIIRDITERKRAEDELRRREWEFRTLAENSPDIIV